MKLLDYLLSMPQDIVFMAVGLLLVLVFLSEKVWFWRKGEDSLPAPPERPRKRFQGPSDPERVKPRKRV